MAKGDTFMGFMILLLIALAFLMCFMIAQGRPAGNWELAGLGQVSYMTVGQGDMLYAFSDNNLYAIDSRGNLNWRVGIPEQWHVLTDQGYYYAFDNQTEFGLDHTMDTPVFDTDGGDLYVCVTSDPKASASQHNGTGWYGYIFGDLQVISVSPTGKVAWSLPISGSFSQLNMVSIDATQDGEYVFHGYNETFIDKKGNVLWNVENVSDPGSVDE
jgi:hypothetical protein